jgi:hypothetical protein
MIKKLGVDEKTKLAFKLLNSMDERERRLGGKFSGRTKQGGDLQMQMVAKRLKALEKKGR